MITDLLPKLANPGPLSARVGSRPRVTDRRDYQRLGLLLFGTIGRRDDRHGCEILDLSANGARVRCETASPLRPRRTGVDLAVGLHKPLKCSIVWRAEDQVGIRFIDDPALIIARLPGVFLPNYLAGLDQRMACAA